MHNLIGFLTSHYGIAFTAIGVFFIVLVIRDIVTSFTYRVRGSR